MNKKIEQHNKKLSKKANVDKYNSQKNFNLYMLPLIIAVAVIPLIVRYCQYNTGLSIFNWYSEDDHYFDFFLYYKHLFFILTCSIMLILVGVRIYHDKMQIKFTPALIPLGIYALLALLSTIFSKYSSFGYSGIFEQFESIFALLGYCLVVYYAFLFINTEDDVKLILRYLIISVFVLGLLGIAQTFGHDFFSTDFGLKNIFPFKYWDIRHDFTFKFGKNRAYLTLYNPNYVGVYVSLVAPILVCLVLSAKKAKTILIYLAALIGLIISLYGSESKTALIAIAFSSIFIIILMRRYIFRNLKVIIPVIAIGICSIIFLLFLNYNTISEKLNTLMQPDTTEKTLTDIKTEENITLTYRGNELRCNLSIDTDNQYNVNLTDANNQNIISYLNPDTSTFEIQDERFTGISIAPVMYENLLCVKIQIDGMDWLFSNQLGDGTYYYINRFGKPDKIITAKSALFTGYESFATGRGYIWSRTIPLLKNHIFLGSGADTFSITFPQQDYVNLYNYGFANEFITKPHNMYLQIGIQTGVLSLLAYLLFYGMYFCSSMYLYIKGRFDSFYSQVGVAIFIGTIGFMVAGLSNDSSIAVSPVYYALIGVGIAVNYKVNMERKIGLSKK